MPVTVYEHQPQNKRSQPRILRLIFISIILLMISAQILIHIKPVETRQGVLTHAATDSDTSEGLQIDWTAPEDK